MIVIDAKGNQVPRRKFVSFIGLKADFLLYLNIQLRGFIKTKVPA